jgi:FkbM family methyltransferase
MTASSPEMYGQLADSSPINLSLCGLLRYPSNDAVLQYLREGWFEYQELVFASRVLRSGDIFIDVGAHCGLYSAVAASCLGPDATIVSVEPNPDLHAYLRNNIVYSRDAVDEPINARARTLVKAAVYSDHDVLKLKRPVAGRSAYASISANFDPDEPIHDEIEVPTRTLLSLLPEASEGALTLIKLDTEGAELAILQQSLPLLPAERPIIFMIEFDEGNLQRSSTSSQELAQVITDNGYFLYQYRASDNTIQPFSGSFPVWGQNLLATKHPGLIDDRLRTLEADAFARTQEFLERGRAAERLYQRSELFDQLVGAIESLGERAHLEWRKAQQEPSANSFARKPANEFFAQTANGAISNANDQFGMLASSLDWIRSDIAAKNEAVAQLQDRTEAQQRRIQVLVEHAQTFAHRLSKEITAIEQGVSPGSIDIPAPDVETTEAVDQMMVNLHDQIGKLSSTLEWFRGAVSTVAQLEDTIGAQDRRIGAIVDHARVLSHRLSQEILAVEQGVSPGSIEIPAPDVGSTEAVDRMMVNLHDQIGKLSSTIEWFRGAVSTVAQLEDTVGAQDRRIGALVEHARTLSQRLSKEIAAIEQGIDPVNIEGELPDVQTTEAVDRMMSGLHDQIGKLASILEWLRDAMSKRNERIEVLSQDRLNLKTMIENLQTTEEFNLTRLTQNMRRLSALGLTDAEMIESEQSMQIDNAWDAHFSKFSSIIERAAQLIREAESSRAMMSHLESELRTSVNAIEALSGQVATMKADIGLAREDLAVVIRALSEMKRAGTQVPGLGGAPVDTAIELAQRVKANLAHAAQLTEAVRQQAPGSAPGSDIAVDGANTIELQNTVRRLTGELRHVNSLATELASSSWMKLGGRVGARASTVLKSIVAVSHASLSVKPMPPVDGSASDQTLG